MTMRPVGRLRRRQGNEAATPVQANIHSGYTPKIGPNHCLKKMAQTGPNRPFSSIVKFRVFEHQSTKNRRRTIMKKTLALVVLTILCGLVAGTIPRWLSRRTPPSTPSAVPGRFIRALRCGGSKSLKAGGARLLKMAGIDSRGLTFEISTSIAFIIKGLV